MGGVRDMKCATAPWGGCGRLITLPLPGESLQLQSEYRRSMEVLPEDSKTPSTLRIRSGVSAQGVGDIAPSRNGSLSGRAVLELGEGK